MSGYMPYVMEKGPYFAVIEDRLSDPVQRDLLLTALYNGVALSSICGFDSTSLDLPPAKTKPKGMDHDGQMKDRVEHLDRDWFGMVQDPSGAWRPHVPVRDEQTGFWTDYQGDTEAILRAAMIRAIEVSLDLAPAGPQGPAASVGTRFWPIDFYWICQGPWFQSWVVWREIESASAGGASVGHVTVVLTTPAAEGYPLTTKITRSKHPPDEEYESPPVADARHRKRGMWVVGHEDYTAVPISSTQRTGFLGIPIPALFYKPRSRKVVCVSPAEWEGGVLAAGRPYTPLPVLPGP